MFDDNKRHCVTVNFIWNTFKSFGWNLGNRADQIHALWTPAPTEDTPAPTLIANYNSDSWLYFKNLKPRRQQISEWLIFHTLTSLWYNLENLALFLGIGKTWETGISVLQH